MASGLSLSNLRSGRGIAVVAVVGAALAGGWYFFIEQSPTAAQGMIQPPVAGAARKPSGPATRPGGAKPMPATRPVVSTLTPRPTIVREEVADPLGPEYVDSANGFSVRFPQGWPIRTFTGETWILDCGDVNTGMISIGFSPCPPTLTADQILPQTIARRIKRQPDTELIAQGKTRVADRKALWSKSTGPLPMTHDSPRMTRVQYIVPLQDGRVLEIRVAAPPEKFERMAPLMKQSMETFHLARRRAVATRR